MEEKITLEGRGLKGKSVVIDKANQSKLVSENTILLGSLGGIWLVAGLTGMTNYPELSILILFIGLCMFNPIIKYIRKAFYMKSGNPLKVLISCIIIGVPAGVIIGFFPFHDNINLFFPAFSVILASIFGLNYFAFKLKMHLAMAVTMFVGAVYIGTNYPHNFWLAGVFTALILLSFAVMSKIYGMYMSYFRK